MRSCNDCEKQPSGLGLGGVELVSLVIFLVVMVCLVVGAAFLAGSQQGKVFYGYTDSRGETGYAHSCWISKGNLLCESATGGYFKVEEYHPVKEEDVREL